MAVQNLARKGARNSAGNAGLFLMGLGTLWYVAFAPLSIAAYQFGCGFALLGLLIALSTKRIGYRRTPLDLPLLLFFAAEAIAAMLSPERGHSLRSLRGEWILLFFFVFSQAIRDMRQLQRAYAVLLASSTVVALYAIGQCVLGWDLTGRHPLERSSTLFIAMGLFGHHLTYGGSVLLTLTIALALASGQASRRETFLARLALPAQALAILASFARTAWAGVLAAMLVRIATLRGKTRILGWGALLLLIGIAAAAQPFRARLGPLVQLSEDPRSRLWATALRIWSDHPIVGSGPGTYAILFPDYKVPGRYMSTGNAHSDPLNVLAGSGLLGLGTFIFLVVSFFRTAVSAYRAAPARDPARPLLLAGILAAVGLLAGGMGQCFLLDEEVATLFWFILAGTMVTARQSPRRSPTGQQAMSYAELGADSA
ncbi:MAG: O-antigen ligase family protein [Candidatus Eisenbacteria bacterium]